MERLRLGNFNLYLSLFLFRFLLHSQSKARLRRSGGRRTRTGLCSVFTVLAAFLFYFRQKSRVYYWHEELGKQ